MFNKSHFVKDFQLHANLVVLLHLMYQDLPAANLDLWYGTYTDHHMNLASKFNIFNCFKLYLANKTFSCL